jgi:hypothetical protein
MTARSRVVSLLDPCDWCLSRRAPRPVSLVIEPAHAVFVIGRSEAFQLFGRDGQEISASNWAVR